MLSRTIIFFLVSSLLVFTSCAEKPAVRPSTIEPYAGPVNVEILKQQINFRNMESVKALAEVQLFKKGELEGSFSGVFGYRSPEAMRISLFGPFGLTVMDFLVADHRLQMHLPPKNILYEWESPGLPLLTLFNDGLIYDHAEEGSSYILQAGAGNETEEEITTRLFFDKTYLTNTAAVFYKDGLEFARADFSGFNGKVPEQIRLSFRNRTEIRISLKETEFNTEIPDEYFKPIDRNGKKVRPFQDILKRFDPNR